MCGRWHVLPNRGGTRAGARFRILEGFDDPLLEHYAHFLAANSIEVTGIEFIRRTDGISVTYDVNTNTIYNARTGATAGR
jgi:hypothetical protein